ncbi:hypothetical protein GCM10009630_62750 [Kribbella jejuensis]|uniref:Uncharacterized protein n=1 Tax=Kribbella jejuensis TaxID=236068 RepID=A0A542EAP4_9ACTN|nr:hypothetical protein [Kribbella jejuensis]TQJ12397.1 hypothetical protein FB475_5340 [Kribbella jejuensis]
MSAGPPDRKLDARVDWTLRDFSLPGHVMVLTATGWRQGWLLARENGSTGWTGLVQYVADAVEIIEYMSADHIASPDSWLSDNPDPPVEA